MNMVGSFVLMALAMVTLMILLLCGLVLFVFILAKIIEDDVEHQSIIKPKTF